MSRRASSGGVDAKKPIFISRYFFIYSWCCRPCSRQSSGPSRSCTPPRRRASCRGIASRQVFNYDIPHLQTARDLPHKPTYTFSTSASTLSKNPTQLTTHQLSTLNTFSLPAFDSESFVFTSSILVACTSLHCSPHPDPSVTGPPTLPSPVLWGRRTCR